MGGRGESKAGGWGRQTRFNSNGVMGIRPKLRRMETIYHIDKRQRYEERGREKGNAHDSKKAIKSCKVHKIG